MQSLKYLSIVDLVAITNSIKLKSSNSEFLYTVNNQIIETCDRLINNLIETNAIDNKAKITELFSYKLDAICETDRIKSTFPLHD